MNQSLQHSKFSDAIGGHACPNCEYEKSSRGRPLVKGDTIICLDCGTSWKELNSAATELKQIPDARAQKEATIAELRKLARNTGDETAEFEESARSQKSSRISPGSNSSSSTQSIAFAFIAVLFLSIIGGSYWLSETSFPIAKKTTELAVSNIQLREQIGRDGKKVITVKGSVQNASDHTKALPPIAIILRKKDGGEIVRWRYTPPKPTISAGVKTRFVSSIQYDTPVVAYAEAIFE